MSEPQVTRAAIEAARKTDWLTSIPGWRGWKTPLTLGYYLSRFQRYEKAMPEVVLDLDNTRYLQLKYAS